MKGKFRMRNYYMEMKQILVLYNKDVFLLNPHILFSTHIQK